jgi:ATP-dependent protease Clp ATPase subunit
MADTTRPPPTCDFCEVPRAKTLKLIVGADASICDECIALCMTLMAHENREWFEKRVEAAREFKPGTDMPQNSN